MEKEIEYERTWLIAKEDLPNYKNGEIDWGDAHKSFRFWTSINEHNEVRYSKRKIDKYNTRYENLIKQDDKQEDSLRKEVKKEITKEEFEQQMKKAIAADIVVGLNLNEIDVSHLSADRREEWLKYMGPEYEAIFAKKAGMFFNERIYPDGFKLYMVEIEFKSLLLSDKFKPPKYFGEEITRSSKYRGKRLALDHFRKEMSALNHLKMMV